METLEQKRKGEDLKDALRTLFERIPSEEQRLEWRALDKKAAEKAGIPYKEPDHIIQVGPHHAPTYRKNESEVEKVKTLLDERVPQPSELSFGTGKPLSHVERVGQALMGDQQYWAGTTGADAYEIRPEHPLKINLEKSIRVFVDGQPDTMHKGSAIMQELDKMESSIKGRRKEAQGYRKIAKSKEPLEVAGKKRQLFTVFKGIHELDDAEFRGKFGESKNRIVDSLGKRMLKEGGLEKYASFKNGLAHPEWLAGYVSLEGVGGIEDPQFKGGKDATGGPAYYVEFLKHYVKRTEENLLNNLEKAEKTNEMEAEKIDRKMLEEAHFEKMKKSPAALAVAAGAEMFGHNRLNTYRKPADEGLKAIGKNYIYTLVKKSKGKHDIAGAERKLPEIFRGLHGLTEAEFRGEFGETKTRVAKSISKKFYEKDMPEIYQRYLGDVKAYVGKMSDKELIDNFTNGRTSAEMLGGKTPDELRTELKLGVDKYMKKIEKVESYFPPEQLESANKIINWQHTRFTDPLTSYLKDKDMKEKAVAELKRRKPNNEFTNAYIKANYGKQ